MDFEGPKKDLAEVEDWNEVDAIASRYSFELRKGRHPDESSGYEVYKAYVSGKKIWTITIVTSPRLESSVTGLEIEPNAQIKGRDPKGLGFGSLMYLLLAKKLAQSGRTLQSDHASSEEALNVWRRFEQKGIAEKFSDCDVTRFRVRHEIFKTQIPNKSNPSLP